MDRKERRLDSAQIAQTMPVLTRWLFRVFGRRINREAARIVMRHYERGRITSAQMHELLREFDPTQDGVFGHIAAN